MTQPSLTVSAGPSARYPGIPSGQRSIGCPVVAGYGPAPRTVPRITGRRKGMNALARIGEGGGDPGDRRGQRNFRLSRPILPQDDRSRAEDAAESKKAGRRGRSILVRFGIKKGGSSVGAQRR